jgi:hypothetical protein
VSGREKTMPSNIKNGRTKKHRVGYIALGYSEEEDFWYSSEGVFASKKAAIKDLEFNYPVDFAYAVKVDLSFPSKGKVTKRK